MKRELQMKLKTRSKLQMIMVMCVTVFILIFQAIGVNFANSPFSLLMVMKPVTAACFLMISISFLMAMSAIKNKVQRVLIYVLALTPCLIGILKCATIALGTHFGESNIFSLTPITA